ncbi:wnt-activated inhibitory factor 2 [Megalops cyprinoides]|uniref:wnt-activated inhibitory factor 2 n=1 Tax=Megalops cyprinoides TaxID=118141 RepID=UPI0018652A10|nr:wnt-activated inhibitory factor 2 [Megalops cyprinoides]
MERRKTWVDYYGNGKAFCIPKRYSCWATVMCVLSLVAKVDNCPAYCTCRENNGTVTCRNLRERTLPTNLPQWANTLIVRDYNITSLLGGSFSHNDTELELVNLSLSGNNIQIIEAYAFLGLTRLQNLDLSHNRLISIASQAFYGLNELRCLCLNDSSLNSAAMQVSNALATDSLRNLQRLELSGNQLKSMPITEFHPLNLTMLVLTNNSIQTLGKENVSSLNEHKEIQVYLASNPFKCNCELDSFYYWLKNASQCADASLLLCSEPESKKGMPLEKLKKDDVECVSSDLEAVSEAVSYVFLGIVLALIGVVFLMVLYLNREGINRWLNNIREACRDQMEVYHYRYEQDSDPRLANVAV